MSPNTFNTFPFVPSADPFNPLLVDMEITSPQAEKVINELQCMDELGWDPYEELNYRSGMCTYKI